MNTTMSTLVRSLRYYTEIDVFNKTKIKIVFWLHFVFSLISHILAPIMIVGVFKVLWGSDLGFWLSGLILGATFFSCTYIINHITHDEGFCCLTSLENYYRIQEEMETVGDFLPRFYTKCKEIIKL